MEEPPLAVEAAEVVKVDERRRTPRGIVAAVDSCKEGDSTNFGFAVTVRCVVPVGRCVQLTCTSKIATKVCC